MEFLVSNKNLSKLCDILMHEMKIKMNESSYKKCYTIIAYHMKLLISKHKKTNIKVSDLVTLMNKECLQLSINFIKTKVSQKKYISHDNPNAPKHHDGNFVDNFAPINDSQYNKKMEAYEDLQVSLEREQMSRQYGGMTRPNNIDFSDQHAPRNNKQPQHQQLPQTQLRRQIQPNNFQHQPEPQPMDQGAAVSAAEADVINNMLNGHQPSSQSDFPVREPDNISPRLNSVDSFNKMRTEREQDVAYLPQKQQFNPMISPSQLDNQMNNTFFLTLEEEEADSMITSLKNDIKNGNHILSQINPYVLNHLDNSQIDLLIKRLSTNITKIHADGFDDIKEEIHELVIKSDEIIEPNMFSNYPVDISSFNMKNITAIELIDIDVPFINKLSNMNKLYLIIDGELHELLIEFTESDISCIIDALNNKTKDFKITVGKNPNNEIYLKHNANKQFSLNNPADSVLKLLGFNLLNYNGKNVYRTNNKHDINNTIYLFLEGIGQDNIPFISIDLKNQKNKLPLKKKFNLKSPKEIYIKFKLSESGEDLVDFNNQPHILKFNFYSS